jgi:hypothetical protein
MLKEPILDEIFLTDEERILRDAKRPVPSPWVQPIIMGVLLSFLAVLWLVSWALRTLTRSARQLPEFAQSHTPAVIAGAVLLFGLALYGVRQRWRAFYAASELGVAVATAYRSAAQLSILHSDQMQWFLALMAAVYIAVRGFDNLAIALKSKSPAASQRGQNPAR